MITRVHPLHPMNHMAPTPWGQWGTLAPSTFQSILGRRHSFPAVIFWSAYDTVKRSFFRRFKVAVKSIQKLTCTTMKLQKLRNSLAARALSLIPLGDLLHTVRPLVGWGAPPPKPLPSEFAPVPKIKNRHHVMNVLQRRTAQTSCRVSTLSPPTNS